MWMSHNRRSKQQGQDSHLYLYCYKAFDLNHWPFILQNTWARSVRPTSTDVGAAPARPVGGAWNCPWRRGVSAGPAVVCILPPCHPEASGYVCICPLRLTVATPHPRSSGCAGAGGPRGATQRSRSGGVVVRRYPSSKVRSSGCTLLEQPWRDTPRPR